MKLTTNYFTHWLVMHKNFTASEIRLSNKHTDTSFVRSFGSSPQTMGSIRHLVSCEIISQQKYHAVMQYNKKQ